MRKFQDGTGWKHGTLRNPKTAQTGALAYRQSRARQGFGPTRQNQSHLDHSEGQTGPESAIAFGSSRVMEKGIKMKSVNVDEDAVFSVVMFLTEYETGERRDAAIALGLVDKTNTTSTNLSEDVAIRLEKALYGDSSIKEACRSLVKRRFEQGYNCEQGAISLLCHMGVPIEIAAAIGIMTLDMEVEPINFEIVSGSGQALGVRIEGCPEGMKIDVDLVPDMAMVWDSPGITMKRSLPDTITSAVTGRRLTSIVSHPALDDFPLLIENITVNKKGDSVIETSGTTSVDVRPYFEAVLI